MEVISVATINDAFQTFLKELGSKADYIYTPQGNTGSKLIQELVSEGISYTNLNGYLLINKNDLDKVRQLNKDILTEQTNIYKETDEKAISEQLKESGKPEMPTMVLDNVPMHLYTNIKDAIKGIPHLIMCPEEKTENTYRINISKNKLLSKKGKNVAQAVLESMLKNIAGDSTKNISKMEEKIKADNYINMYQTATNAYHITSEIDPSVFMTVSKDGFAMCHWQVSTKGLERVVDYRENISDIDYEARFNKALERFPDFTGKLIPFGRHAGMSGADIGDDVLHMESGDVRSPVGNGKTVILFQAVNAKIPHPVRITLFPGDLKNDVLIESLVYLEVIVLGVPKIVPAVTDFIQIGLLVHIRPLLQAEIALKAVCINLIDERSISLIDNVSFCENVNPVHMEGFQNAGGMGDDQQRMFCVFHVSCNPMADGLDRVNIQT